MGIKKVDGGGPTSCHRVCRENLDGLICVRKMAPCMGRRFSPLRLICFTSLLAVLIMPPAESFGMDKSRQVLPVDSTNEKRKAKDEGPERSHKKIKFELKKKLPAAPLGKSALSRKDTGKMSGKDTGKRPQKTRLGDAASKERRVQDVESTKRQPEELVVWLESTNPKEGDSAPMTHSETSTTTTSRRVIIECQATSSQIQLFNCVEERLKEKGDPRVTSTGATAPPITPTFKTVYGLANNLVFLSTLSAVFDCLFEKETQKFFFLNCVPPTRDDRCNREVPPYVIKSSLQRYEFPEMNSWLSKISIKLIRGVQGFRSISLQNSDICAKFYMEAPMGTKLTTSDENHILGVCPTKTCKLSLSHDSDEQPSEDSLRFWQSEQKIEHHVYDGKSDMRPSKVFFPNLFDKKPLLRCWDGISYKQTGGKDWTCLDVEGVRSLEIIYLTPTPYGVIRNSVSRPP